MLSLVNNYDDLGGKKQYVEWARNQGQSINSEDDFFTNPIVKGYYKNHIKVNASSLYYVFPIFINIIYPCPAISWFFLKKKWMTDVIRKEIKREKDVIWMLEMNGYSNIISLQE